MPNIKIKQEFSPTRCEVCHQSDCFTPNNNYCSRCQNLLIKEGITKPIPSAWYLGNTPYSLARFICYPDGTCVINNKPRNNTFNLNHHPSEDDPHKIPIVYGILTAIFLLISFFETDAGIRNTAIFLLVLLCCLFPYFLRVYLIRLYSRY